MMKFGMFARDNDRPNGEAETLDVEHELPAGEDGAVETQPSADSSVLEAELAKIRSARDALLDRMARMQADLDNARKRAQREQQEHCEYALTQAKRTLLPTVDSFDRAVTTVGSGDDMRMGVQL